MESWKGADGIHSGPEIQAVNGFSVIECRECGYKHVVPIPTAEELTNVYSHEYYTQEKPLYIDRYTEDLEWWDKVYTARYNILEKHLSVGSRRILDVGSGPGYFLLNGRKRGWQVQGIEPSEKAAKYSKDILGLDIENCFFNEQTENNFGQFDAINMGEVLEHLPAPADMLHLVRRHLTAEGMLCLIVPNDFNPFQLVLRNSMGFEPWWVAPPHHLNYFNFKSLAKLVERCGFEVVHTESTFPIDIFLLMGKNYIGDDRMGRDCHKLRMEFEKNIYGSSSEALLSDLYGSFAKLGIGREVVLFARKTVA